MDSNWTEEPFDILKGISNLVNNSENKNEARNMVIRALQYADQLDESYKNILYSLTKQVGLYPYITDANALSLSDQIALEIHRPFNMDDEDIIFHIEQAKAYWALLNGNNVILSAPTSFGKSLIIDALISLNKYNNIVIIVPTLALIDETRRRIQKFGNRYKIITHLNQSKEKRNIIIMTQERILIYPELNDIDLFIIDEFYKLHPKEDPERAYALNQAFYKLYKTGAQFYFLGPNIKRIPVDFENKIKHVPIFSEYNTVVSEITILSTKPSREKVISIFCHTHREPTLIYCRSVGSLRKLASYLIESSSTEGGDELDDMIKWLSIQYHPEWIVVKALSIGVGLHHGRLPRAIGQYIVRAFNKGLLRVLICTSTLIEGVNTSAKNVIVYDNKIALKNLDFFTFNNIRGRSGRMFKHFVGNVYIFDPPPEEELPLVDIPIITQDENAPASLLMGIDWDDLSDKSKEQLKPLREQEYISIDILKQNINIDPFRQIELAKEIMLHPKTYAHNLQWKSIPATENLYYICNLIWNYFLPDKRKRSTVASGKQLAFKIIRLMNNNDIKKLIDIEIDNGTDPDDAVEDTLDFLRNWATYHFPQYIRSLDRIQNYVFNKIGMATGNYNYFADMVENLFLPPFYTALDEYGIPLQITQKISFIFNDEDNLDSAIIKIKTVNLEKLNITPYETELLSDVRKNI